MSVLILSSNLAGKLPSVMVNGYTYCSMEEKGTCWFSRLLASVNYVTVCLLDIFYALLTSAIFHIINIFDRLFQGYHQSVNSLDQLSGLTWVQPVCKGYQQTMLEDKVLQCKQNGFSHPYQSD